MKNLLDKVKQDIDKFLSTDRLFFINENDFQSCLALYLSKCPNDYKVYSEYLIPIENGSIQDYPWHEKTISIDLVVEKDDEFVPIELKYKTRSIDEPTLIYRFGNSLKVKQLIKDQSAQDIGRYAFWKDVKRLELLKERFENVVGGIAAFVTNDESYTTAPKSNKAPLVGYYDFRMYSPTGEDKQITGKLCWRENGEQVPWDGELCNFELKGTYTLPDWQHYKTNPKKGFGENKMHYMIVTVKDLK